MTFSLVKWLKAQSSNSSVKKNTLFPVLLCDCYCVSFDASKHLVLVHFTNIPSKTLRSLMCSFLNELKDLSVGDFIRINKKDQISMLGHDPAVH